MIPRKNLAWDHYTKGERSLMMRKFLLKLEKEEDNPAQRNSLFRTAYKTKDRVWKVIVGSGSTDNLVSTEMVKKLELETVVDQYEDRWSTRRNLGVAGRIFWYSSGQTTLFVATYQEYKPSYQSYTWS